MVRLGLELLTVLLLLQGVVQIIFIGSHLACPLPPSTTIVITVRVAGIKRLDRDSDKERDN